jgi:hypothetical protein
MNIINVGDIVEVFELDQAIELLYNTQTSDPLYSTLEELIDTEYRFQDTAMHCSAFITHKTTNGLYKLSIDHAHSSNINDDHLYPEEILQLKSKAILLK